MKISHNNAILNVSDTAMQKFAEILYDVSRMQKPPFSLFMGEAAFKSAENKIAWVSEDIKATQGYAGAAADFSDSAGSAFDKR
ncbi:MULTISPECIES: hypothetical protein [Helicobacter]|jgi:hypothetical protein|uniref:hypothetical protein n=1 Tax=Helicobacter TaxID=209 RepID=UPI0002E5CFA9|nr:hypothetical protein [Helicobacter hepaticus]